MKIYTLGGYNKVGKNMTAVEVEDEIVILDMGLDLEAVIHQDEEFEKMSAKHGFQSGALPDDAVIHDQREKVKAIVIGHGHLDHVGGYPRWLEPINVPLSRPPIR